MENTIQGFINELSSKSPVPGGGGASAMIGAIGVSLCSMTANLTSGKKKYAEYQQDIDRILERTGVVIEHLLVMVEKDAQVFEPLSSVYGIPKETPGREEIMESALMNACTVPFEILQEVNNIIPVIEELAVKCSRLALSDVGIAASACRCAMEGAAMSVYINTKLFRNKSCASRINSETARLLEAGTERCNKISAGIIQNLIEK